MAATTKLPAIDCVQVSPKRGDKSDGRTEEVSKKEAKRKEEVAAFLASVRLGSLERQPRPGDVLRRSRYARPNASRPLGLIPDRGYMPTYARLLPPVFPAVGLTSAVALPDHERLYDVEYGLGNGRASPAGSYATAFRYINPGHEDVGQRAVSHAVNTATEDREYADTLAKCKMQDYMSSEVNVAQKYDVNVPLLNRHRRTKTVPETGTKLAQYANTNTGQIEYLSFINQASLRRKNLFLDQRYAAECGVCERCTGRKGRCARCLAIRVGGGYIILDGSELPEERRASRNSYRYNWSGRKRSDLDNKSHTKKEFGYGVLTDSSHVIEYGGGGEGGGEGGTGGWDGGERGRGEGAGVGGGWGEGKREKVNEGFEYGVSKSRKGGGVGGDTGDGKEWSVNLGDDKSRRYGNTSSERRDDGGSAIWDGDGMESGRQSNMSGRPGSKMSGSRPGSRFGTRPPSSMRRLGRDHRKKGVKIERQTGGERLGSEEDGGSDENSKNRRRHGREGNDKGDEDNGDQNGRLRYDYHHGNDDLEATNSGSLGNLMRFKPRRRDDVKALKATLRELQDIDPLDYLAKYCIIDKEKLPHYQRVYENVDRDEDDEIDILELDFALKAVNFDLISDSELSYVNSVLELAGRHKLNFRFFCLIAALSEKVVALDDMVKRLINKMDFEALEVKLKKCKELFYLLADTEHESVEQGGVVTVSSLAVELQAGGLTQEHVDYVCNHMNHEDRGLVEFLDYLTYVPLFVEIHDNIYDNPLDFTRTK